MRLVSPKRQHNTLMGLPVWDRDRCALLFVTGWPGELWSDISSDQREAVELLRLQEIPHVQILENPTKRILQKSVVDCALAAASSERRLIIVFTGHGSPKGIVLQGVQGDTHRVPATPSQLIAPHEVPLHELFELLPQRVPDPLLVLNCAYAAQCFLRERPVKDEESLRALLFSELHSTKAGEILLDIRRKETAKNLEYCQAVVQRFLNEFIALWQQRDQMALVQEPTPAQSLFWMNIMVISCSEAQTQFCTPAALHSAAIKRRSSLPQLIVDARALQSTLVLDQAARRAATKNFAASLLQLAPPFQTIAQKGAYQRLRISLFRAIEGDEVLNVVDAKLLIEPLRQAFLQQGLNLPLAALTMLEDLMAAINSVPTMGLACNSIDEEFLVSDYLFESSLQTLLGNGMQRSTLAFNTATAGQVDRGDLQRIMVFPLAFGRAPAAPRFAAFLLGQLSMEDLVTHTQSTRRNWRNSNEIVELCQKSGVDVTGPMNQELLHRGRVRVTTEWEDGATLSIVMVAVKAIDEHRFSEVTLHPHAVETSPVQKSGSPPKSTLHLTRLSTTLASPTKVDKLATAGQSAPNDLEVKVLLGGAFLISYRDYSLVVDGGMETDALDVLAPSSLVGATNGREIQMAILSANDQDHSSGLLAWLRHRVAEAQSLPHSLFAFHGLPNSTTSSVTQNNNQRASIGVHIEVTQPGMRMRKILLPGMARWTPHAPHSFSDALRLALDLSDSHTLKYDLVALPHHGAASGDPHRFFQDVLAKHYVIAGHPASANGSCVRPSSMCLQHIPRATPGLPSAPTVYITSSLTSFSSISDCKRFAEEKNWVVKCRCAFRLPLAAKSSGEQSSCEKTVEEASSERTPIATQIEKSPEIGIRKRHSAAADADPKAQRRVALQEPVNLIVTPPEAEEEDDHKEETKTVEWWQMEKQKAEAGDDDVSSN